MQNASTVTIHMVVCVQTHSFQQTHTHTEMVSCGSPVFTVYTQEQDHALMAAAHQGNGETIRILVKEAGCKKDIQNDVSACVSMYVRMPIALYIRIC